MKRKILKCVSVCLALVLLCFSWCHADILLYFGQAEPGAQTPWFPPPPSEPGRHDVAIIETRQIIPGEGLPKEAVIQKSNNNLASIRWQGRTWLVWRTASSHYPTPTATMQVVSSADEKVWRFEDRIAMDTDLREPQFLVIDNALFLYYTELGDSAWTFTPKEVLVTRRNLDGTWTAPRSIGLPKHVIWSIQTIAGRPYMTAYDHGESLFALTGGPPLEVRLLTTDDGWVWRPADVTRPAIHTGGGSETDFALGGDGRLYGVMRNEFGEGGDYGSLVCTAPAGRWSEWTCLRDKKKYDSPRVFAYDGEVYLIARRNMTASGNFDRDVLFEGVRNSLDYISKGKRCSLWRFADEGKRIAFMLDLPSKGDTCFASVMPGESEGEFIVYDYTSPLEGPDQAWTVGQRSPSVILRHVLKFTKRP